MPNGVSVVVPAWNEEERIGRALKRYLTVLSSIEVPFEVIVVVDGVKDRTAEIARTMTSQGVRVLEIDQRLYKGGAVKRGLQEARFSKVGYLDADSPITNEDILKLIRATDHVDAAIGSRRLPGSVETGHTPLPRRVFRVCFNALTRSVLGLPLSDTQCGAKFFRKERLDQIMPDVRLHGWAFDAAILFNIRRSGGTISEFPVAWNHDPRSKLPLAEQVPVMLLSVFFIRILSFRVVRHVPQKWTWWFARTFMKRTPPPTREGNG
ncbi:MAG: glycosyltransferase [Isosphaeraceae bacterium]